MSEFIPELKFDNTINEEKFNKFYENFFEVKMLKYLKHVKSTHYKCSSECVEAGKIDKNCLAKCQEPHTNFFKRIELVLKNELVKYQPCIDSCRENKLPVDCVEECSEKILKNLSQINIDKEFRNFLT